MNIEQQRPTTEAADGRSDSAACLERLAFENWFTRGVKGCKSIERSGDVYRLMAAYQAWQVWQARAAIQTMRGEYICHKCGLRQELCIKEDCG